MVLAPIVCPGGSAGFVSTSANISGCWCMQAAFKRKRRSMLAADVIEELGGVVDELTASH